MGIHVGINQCSRLRRFICTETRRYTSSPVSGSRYNNADQRPYVFRRVYIPYIGWLSAEVGRREGGRFCLDVTCGFSFLFLLQRKGSNIHRSSDSWSGDRGPSTISSNLIMSLIGGDDDSFSRWAMRKIGEVRGAENRIHVQEEEGLSSGNRGHNIADVETKPNTNTTA